MFKKFARLPNRTERLEIYNLVKFNLGACLKLVEFLTLLLLISGVAWMIATPLMRGGFWNGSAAAIGLFVLIFRLVRLPFLAAESGLAAAFGLDPRPASQRLGGLVALEARRGLVLWLLSLLLFWGLRWLDLWLWTLLTLALGLALTALQAARPGLWSPESLRPLREDELPPALLAKIERWAPKTGLDPKSILVSVSFSPELRPPRLAGLFSQRLIVAEKALAAFPPRELTLLTVAAALGTLVKAPLKFLLLRGCALAVSVPLAAILITTAGAELWLYPVSHSPALITLLWAGLWLGWNLGELAARLTRRALDTQLTAAASVLLKDEDAPGQAADTLAEKNLEEEAPSAWRELFRERYSRRLFTARVKYQQHLSKFTEE